MKGRWVVAVVGAVLLSSLGVAADSLDEIKADLAACRTCPYRTLLQARVNYRLKMVQASQSMTVNTMRSVPGNSSTARNVMSNVAANLTSNAGAGAGNPIPVSPAAQNAVLKGITSMAAYVSVYGTDDINAAEVRLAVEQQFRDLGITVLGHTSPPSYPVFNLVIRDTASSQTVTTSTYNPNAPAGFRNGTQTTNVPTVTYELSAELHRLSPSTNKDETFWKLTDNGEAGQIGSVAIADEALKLAIGFVNAWSSVNAKLPPTTFKAKPAIVPGPPPETNHPEIVLLKEVIQPLFKGATDSFFDVHETQRAAVEKQMSDLMAAGQKVITCQYGPKNAQTPEGFTEYSFWYPAPPADIVKDLVSAGAHPFMRLGLISVTKCPSIAAGAEQIFRQRFN